MTHCPAFHSVRGVSIAFLIASLLAAARSPAAPPGPADGVTRVTAHREGTALEVFRDLTEQGNVLLGWTGPEEGPRLRFDVEREPFWPAILRACEAYNTHVIT